ncbi:Membrane protein TerC, possibly involved in tellurium resistance [Faunimonas pinastri]|uniref:Membrane protein TerC, possibly involved in tellurium resistance n=1 Tax=Faunimonas pinastri TaxID=1855383 RepID=A0A1H9LAT1_9HYPH|nr:TerC family protein [Faunimonas pinastri]SER08113.1 Membrane protein TerC, possibly involved in tellurium resistance [Faunimonas pinastri]
MIDLLANPEAWAAFLTLTVMEIVLGIDNVVFLSLLVARVPEPQAQRARQIGLALAFVFRVILLLGLSWLIGLTQPVVTVFGQGFSWRDIILIAGGLFLLYKATTEIHGDIEGQHGDSAVGSVARSFALIIAQIVVVDLVFSIDSILTAIGMADHVEIMIAAVLVAIVLMYVASGPIAGFVHRNPTTKMLALGFLLLIGMALIADGLNFHIPRAYIYFAMGFAVVVEVFNLLAKRRRVAGG